MTRAVAPVTATTLSLPGAVGAVQHTKKGRTARYHSRPRVLPMVKDARRCNRGEETQAGLPPALANMEVGGVEGFFIGLLLAVALMVNVPLGMWRRSMRRFSPAWFLAIHASIPLLVAMRLTLGPPIWVILPEIALIVAGQLIGARLPGLWSEGSQS